MTRMITLLAVFCYTSLFGINTLMQDKIEHVVVIMMENRSFDNLLAWAYSKDVPLHFIPSNTDPVYKGLNERTLINYTNTLKDSFGRLVFSSPPIKGIPSVMGTPYLNSPCYDPQESFPHVTQQIYGNPPAPQPTMTGFLQDYASLWYETEWVTNKADLCACLETYTEAELPIVHALARHYAVSDYWFASVPTMTNPNRAFAACGTSLGQVINGPEGQNSFPTDTIWNLLSDISPESTWMIFWQGDMFPGVIEGPLTGPNNFVNMNNIPNLQDHYLKIDGFHELARAGKLPRYSFIEPQYTSLMSLHNLKLQLGKSAKIVNPFNSTVGVQGNDFHPPGDVRTAENLLANIYTSLISNSDAWNKTLFVILFDEHGGLFDHVPPPAATPPDSHNENGFNFDRYGVRVPALFISPLIDEKTCVRSSNPNIPFDHTSLLATVLNWFKIDKKEWRFGNRTLQAPTFDSVLTRQIPREDKVILPPQTTLPPPNSSQIVQIGDTLYLKDKEGHYILKNEPGLLDKGVRVGAEGEKMPFIFRGGQGSLTHGSFVILQAQDDALGDENIMESVFIDRLCRYGTNQHQPEQWWTAKSASTPYLGREIAYGDKIFLENHLFEDLYQYVPARLAKDDFIFLNHSAKTIPITDPDSDEFYWILEKANQT